MRSWIPLSLLPIALASCGEGIRSLATDPLQPVSCDPNTALIAVYDGLLENLCGCAEPAGTIVASGTALTCTVPVGTRVTFQYVATLTPHQILSTSTPTFVSSLAHDPLQGIYYPSHGIALTTAGTYLFADGFDAGLRGSIVVTP
jgi:hypothetical protein